MEKKFIADSMLGKLARWLRVIGCDTMYFTSIDDADLVALAEETGRVILTRDTLLIRRRKARDKYFFISSDHFRLQLRQVVEAFSIEPSKGFLTRCLECNERLGEISRDCVLNLVPPYVFATQSSFRCCPSCGRIYWAGTQREHMLQEILEMFAPAPFH